MAKIGRPPKNNCDYFRHFTTMRNHRKVKALRNKFGQVLGYAFWAMFLEYLTGLDGNEMEYSDMEVELFAADLGISATEIRTMIDFCLKMEMVFLRDGFISSDSLDKEFVGVYEKRQNAKEISDTRKRRENGTFDSNTESLGLSATENTNGQDNSGLLYPQIREEKIREEKKRTNTLSESADLLTFDQFRKLFGGTKRGNETEFLNFKKKHKDWNDVLPKLPEIILTQIENRKQKELKRMFVPQWKNLQTWINQRCWEEECLIPEPVKQYTKGGTEIDERTGNPKMSY